jgi:predicted ATPase
MLAATLVSSAPELRILATSREALGIAGERLLAVPTLSLPDPDDPQQSAETPGEAVQLFAERAAAVLPGFAVAETSRDTVERICRQLDGLPLAIELAAVRLRMLSPEQLLTRLENRFHLLTTGPRAGPPRQRTLRALVDWSYALCTEPERLLWARASVFAGGLDLEAAEEVCSGEGVAREDVLDLVTSLVNKSVLVREEIQATVRYRMLETIRQYGREQLLACGEEPAMRRRHRDYYRGLAARARAQMFGPDQVEWFDRQRIEHANLRQALEYCFAVPGEIETGLGMTADLFHHWMTGDFLGEGRARLDQGLAVVTEASEMRGRALWVNAWLAITQADVVTAEASVRQARELGEQLGLQPVLAYAALYSAMIAMYRGDGESAVAHYEEAVARHRATGDPMGLTMTLFRLCLARALLGDTSRAVAAGEECLAVCEAHGDRWVRAYGKTVLGVALWLKGDAQRAAALERESLRFQHSIDDLLGSRINVEVLAWIAAGQGFPAETRTRRPHGAVQVQARPSPPRRMRVACPRGARQAGIRSGRRSRCRAVLRRGDRFRPGCGRSRGRAGRRENVMVAADAQGDRDSAPRRAGDEQQGDRSGPGDSPANRRGTCRAHTEQARLQLPHPDRRLGQGARHSLAGRVARAHLTCRAPTTRRPAQPPKTRNAARGITAVRGVSAASGTAEVFSAEVSNGVERVRSQSEKPATGRSPLTGGPRCPSPPTPPPSPPPFPPPFPRSR